MAIARNIQTAWRQRSPCSGALLLVAALALTACGGGHAAATATPANRPDSSALPTVTSPPAPTPSPTRLPGLDALLAPGPTFPLPERLFFRNGPDLWQLPAGGAPARVTTNLRLGPYAVTPDGAHVAVVVYAPTTAPASEEIRVLGPDGAATATLYGPTPTSGANAAPSIVSLAWSWDAKTLAVAFNDGTLRALPAAGGAPLADPVMQPLAGVTAAATPLAGVEWAPSGGGVAYLVALADGSESLLTAPLGQAAHPAVDGAATPRRAARAFVWLPGRGRIAYVEDDGGQNTPGSIFTVAPDGTSRELLVSSGGFAPVAGAVALAASPDGQKLAFTIYTPDGRGLFTYQSLWVLNIDSGELTQVPVTNGYRVSDLWWLSSGLVWRGVQRDATPVGDQTTYDGVAPFILGQFDVNGGQSTLVYQSGS